jgi:hypothetical protein
MERRCRLSSSLRSIVSIEVPNIQVLSSHTRTHLISTVPFSLDPVLENSLLLQLADRHLSPPLIIPLGNTRNHHRRSVEALQRWRQSIDDRLNSIEMLLRHDPEVRLCQKLVGRDAHVVGFEAGLVGAGHLEDEAAGGSGRLGGRLGR